MVASIINVSPSHVCRPTVKNKVLKSWMCIDKMAFEKYRVKQFKVCLREGVLVRLSVTDWKAERKILQPKRWNNAAGSRVTLDCSANEIVKNIFLKERNMTEVRLRGHHWLRLHFCSHFISPQLTQKVAGTSYNEEPRRMHYVLSERVEFNAPPDKI